MQLLHQIDDRQLVSPAGPVWTGAKRDDNDDVLGKKRELLFLLIIITFYNVITNSTIYCKCFVTIIIKVLIEKKKKL